MLTIPLIFVFFIIGILLVVIIYRDKYYFRKSLLCKPYENQNESFSQDAKIISHTNDTIYDEYYSDIYDILLLSKDKNIYEIENVIRLTRMDESSRVLDVGCGTGHHVNGFTVNKISAIGIDNSKYMIDKSKQNYPNCIFKQGDILNYVEIPSKFTHITCFYFTIYYFKNKQLFFQNCFDTLTHGGYLVIHLVDRTTFDPVVPQSNPFYLVNPQKYAKKRINNSYVKFTDFTYNSRFR